MRRIAGLMAAVLVACGGGAARGPGPAYVGGPTATPLFCAYGGVGIVPDPLPSGYETEFVEMVVSVDNPGAPIAGLAVGSAGLIDGSGHPLAALHRVDHLVVLPGIEAESETMGRFAVYMNPEGMPFDGTLPTGTTILRARYSIDRSAPQTFPSECTLELTGGAAPIVARRSIDGSWPTS